VNSTQLIQKIIKGQGLNTLQELCAIVYCDEYGLEWVKNYIEKCKEINKNYSSSEGETVKVLPEETYLSNKGRGPMVARIVCVRNGIVTLERKAHANAKHWITFTLSEKAFNSKSCGWKKFNTKESKL
jgi:hypothetical protein